MDTRAAILTLLLALPACSEGGDGVPGPGNPNASSSLKDRLTGGTQTLELQPASSSIDVTAQMGDQTVRTTLKMLHGATSVRAESDGSLIVEDITLGVDDIIVHHDLLPPEGIHLMNIQAHLDGQMDARTTWMNDNELVADTVGDMVVEWAIMNDEGKAAPLAPQPLASVPFDIHLERGRDGELRISLTGAVGGEFWSWADYVRLSDLDFFVATATPPDDLPADDIVE